MEPLKGDESHKTWEEKVQKKLVVAGGGQSDTTLLLQKFEKTNNGGRDEDQQRKSSEQKRGKVRDRRPRHYRLVKHPIFLPGARGKGSRGKKCCEVSHGKKKWGGRIGKNHRRRVYKAGSRVLKKERGPTVKNRRLKK